MKPVNFREVNKTLGKPASMSDDECGSLPVYTNGEHCISCWKADSFLERVRLLITGRIFLTVVSGDTQPPVSIVAVNPTMFYRWWMADKVSK